MSKIFTYPFRPLDWAATPQDKSGDNADVPSLGVYAVETTKRYIPGTRKITWDGRVFKYAYAISAVVPYHGCHAGEAGALSYTACPSAVSAGQRYAIATLASRTEDDLAGGYFVLYHSTIDNTTQYGIVGNEATSGTTTRIYLDAPTAYASTTSFAHEVYENPYRECSHTTSGTLAILGVPMMNASSEYFWMQTWGPCLVSGGEALDTAVDCRVVKWGSNNVLFDDATKTAGQIAGYQLQGDNDNAGPLIMLMCST